MILLLTNSLDGTSDVIVSLAVENDIELFRWNVDLWQHYELNFTESKFTFIDKYGRKAQTSNPDLQLMWRKPFIDLMSFAGLNLSEGDKQNARAQMGQWLQSVVADLSRKKQIRLVEPYADRRLPKLLQLSIANRFFSVPKSLFSVIELNNPSHIKMIAKPLGDPLIGENHIFYSSLVDASGLKRPFPWFLQYPLIGGLDITCLHICGINHFYSCDFIRSEGSIDWRIEINNTNQSKWRPFDHPMITEWNRSINSFMDEIGLKFGRLDFILQDNEFWFLECNTNGQFGWLDNPNTLQLHRLYLNVFLNERSVI